MPTLGPSDHSDTGLIACVGRRIDQPTFGTERRKRWTASVVKSTGEAINDRGFPDTSNLAEDAID